MLTMPTEAPIAALIKQSAPLHGAGLPNIGISIQAAIATQIPQLPTVHQIIADLASNWIGLAGFGFSVIAMLICRAMLLHAMLGS